MCACVCARTCAWVHVCFFTVIPIVYSIVLAHSMHSANICGLMSAQGRVFLQNPFSSSDFILQTEKPRSWDVICIGQGPAAGKGQSWDSNPSPGLSPVPFVPLEAASFPSGLAG